MQYKKHRSLTNGKSTWYFRIIEIHRITVVYLTLPTHKLITYSMTHLYLSDLLFTPARTRGFPPLILLSAFSTIALHFCITRLITTLLVYKFTFQNQRSLTYIFAVYTLRVSNVSDDGWQSGVTRTT